MYKNKIGEACGTSSYIRLFPKYLKNAKRFLEIGTYDGIIVSLLAEKLPNIQFYVIDPFINGENSGAGHKDYFLKNTQDLANIHLYENKTEDVKPFDNSFFDFAFIDGDHSYRCTKIDIEFCWDSVKSGGYIAIHDYFIMEGVRKAIDEFINAVGVNFVREEDVALIKRK